MRRLGIALAVLVAAAAVLWLLFTVIFPEVERFFSEDPTVHGPPPSTTAAPPAATAR